MTRRVNKENTYEYSPRDNGDTAPTRQLHVLNNKMVDVARRGFYREVTF